MLLLIVTNKNRYMSRTYVWIILKNIRDSQSKIVKQSLFTLIKKNLLKHPQSCEFRDKCANSDVKRGVFHKYATEIAYYRYVASRRRAVLQRCPSCR